MESHPQRFVSFAIAPESSCHGLQRRLRRGHPHSTHARPIKAFEKSRELSRRKPHHRITDRRPPERALFQPLGNKHDTGTIPEQQLYAIRAFGPKDVDDAAIRVRTEALAHPGSQAIHALTKIDRLRRDQDLHAAGRNDHVAAFTARKTSFSIVASEPGGTRTVATPITISMIVASVLMSATGGAAITTGTKEAAGRKLCRERADANLGFAADRI